jgi:hypothetical protein
MADQLGLRRAEAAIGGHPAQAADQSRALLVVDGVLFGFVHRVEHWPAVVLRLLAGPAA